MARAAIDVAGDACVGGVVVVPRGGSSARLSGAPLSGVDLMEAGHPLPDAASEAAGTRVLATVGAADCRTLVVVLLSGGASALLAVPASGLSLADKQAVTAALLSAGAEIASVNAVRKHASRIKGGGLARAAAHAAGLWTFILSDVIGDDPATIASGPTVADPTTFADAIRVLSLHLTPEAVPAAIRAHRARGACMVRETSKPGDAVPTHAHGGVGVTGTL